MIVVWMFVVLLVIGATSSYASEEKREYAWLGLHFGAADISGQSDLVFGEMRFNLPAYNRQWAISIRGYDQDFLFTSQEDEGESIDGRIRELGITRVWHRPTRWNYYNVSAGLSLLRADIGTGCKEPESTGFLRVAYQCSREQFTTLGIPLRASFGVGRYVGIAFSLEANVNPEESFLAASISYSLGAFAY